MQGQIFSFQKEKTAESLLLAGWEVGLEIPLIEPEENRKDYFLSQGWFGGNLKKVFLLVLTWVWSLNFYCLDGLKTQAENFNLKCTDSIVPTGN